MKRSKTLKRMERRYFLGIFLVFVIGESCLQSLFSFFSLWLGFSLFWDVIGKIILLVVGLGFTYWFSVQKRFLQYIRRC